MVSSKYEIALHWHAVGRARSSQPGVKRPLPCPPTSASLPLYCTARSRRACARCGLRQTAESLRQGCLCWPQPAALEPCVHRSTGAPRAAWQGPAMQFENSRLQNHIRHLAVIRGRVLTGAHKPKGRALPNARQPLRAVAPGSARPTPHRPLTQTCPVPRPSWRWPRCGQTWPARPVCSVASVAPTRRVGGPTRRRAR